MSDLEPCSYIEFCNIILIVGEPDEYLHYKLDRPKESYTMMNKELNLCKEHRQEENQSHFAKHNCDYCKLKEENKNLTVTLEYIAEIAHAGGLKGYSETEALTAIRRKTIQYCKWTTK